MIQSTWSLQVWGPWHICARFWGLCQTGDPVDQVVSVVFHTSPLDIWSTPGTGQEAQESGHCHWIQTSSQLQPSVPQTFALLCITLPLMQIFSFTYLTGTGFYNVRKGDSLLWLSVLRKIPVME